MTEELPLYTALESCRNQITRGGVVLYRVKFMDDGIAKTKWIIRCTEHAAASEYFRNVTLARKYFHKPWAFCPRCEKIWKRHLRGGITR